MATALPTGIVSIQGHQSVDATVAKLKTLLEAKGVKLFALVDHSGEAEKAGLRMPNTKLLIFGNPAAGTPFMLAAPTAALDLPLRILIAEDGEGRTWITYTDPDYLMERHGAPPGLASNLAAIRALASDAAR